MSVFLVSVVVVGLAMVAMGVGLLFGRGCLTGTCGTALVETRYGPVRCPWCPKRANGLPR